MEFTATHSLSRRALLRTVLLGGAAMVAACSTTQTGTVTTVTIDTTRLVTDARAIVAALTTALAIPGVAALLGSNLAVAAAALAAANTVLNEIVQLVGSSVTLTVDTAKLQSLVVSLLGDAQTVLSLLQTPPAAGMPALPTQLQLLINAAVTLIPLVQVAAGLASSPPRHAPMTEAEALRIAAAA